MAVPCADASSIYEFLSALANHPPLKLILHKISLGFFNYFYFLSPLFPFSSFSFFLFLFSSFFLFSFLFLSFSLSFHFFSFFSPSIFTSNSPEHFSPGAFKIPQSFLKRAAFEMLLIVGTWPLVGWGEHQVGATHRATCP